MIKFLTQAHCGQCVALKTYLEKGLKGQYDQHIEYVSREENPEEFMKYVQQFKIMSTPALIAGDEVLLDPKPGNVKAFLEKAIGWFYLESLFLC